MWVSALQIGGKRVDQISRPRRSPRGRTEAPPAGTLLAIGPPTTVRKSARAAAGARCRSARRCWICIPLIRATSAQARSRSRSRSTLASTRRFVPRMRQQRRYRHQPRRLRGAFALKREGVAKTPVGIGEARINQQHVHDCISTGKGHRRIVLPLLLRRALRPCRAHFSVLFSAPGATADTKELHSNKHQGHARKEFAASGRGSPGVQETAVGARFFATVQSQPANR